MNDLQFNDVVNYITMMNDFITVQASALQKQEATISELNRDSSIMTNKIIEYEMKSESKDNVIQNLLLGLADQASKANDKIDGFCIFDNGLSWRQEYKEDLVETLRQQSILIDCVKEISTKENGYDYEYVAVDCMKRVGRSDPPKEELHASNSLYMVEMDLSTDDEVEFTDN
tara:strand:- start:479 stop:994 length:516 start_codon:yes stop_codon:yes gene_type:complete